MHDERLGDVGQGAEDAFDLLGVDVLTVGAKDHCLAAAADEDESVAVDDAQIARLEPSVGRHGGGRSVRILVVTEHDVHAAHLNLAGGVHGVGRVDTHLHAVDRAADRTGAIRLPVFVRDKRTALGHAVAYGIAEADAMQELFDLLIDGRATDDDLGEVATEGCAEGLADASIDEATDAGQAAQEACRGFVDLREDACADDLFDDQGHGDDESRADGGEGVDDHLGVGHARQEVDVATLVDAIHNLEGQAIHVGHGEHADEVIAGLDEAQMVGREARVAPEAAVGQHDAFGVSRGAGGVVKDGHLVRLFDVHMQAVGREEGGVTFGEVRFEAFAEAVNARVATEDHAPVLQEEGGREVGHGVGRELLPAGGGGQQDFRLGVADDVMHILGMEVVEDGRSHGTIGKDAEEGDDPARGVASDEGYAIALTYAGMFEQEV